MTSGAEWLRAALERAFHEDPETGRSPALLRAMLALSVGATLLIAAVLVLFTHPMGDDFCNSVNVHQFGVLESLRREYLNWGGRWSSVFPALGFPALFEITRWYPLALVAAGALQVFALWFLLTTALELPGRSRLAWSLTLTLLAIHWAGMPHPGQTTYFVEGAWVYSVNVSLAMVLITCLLRLPQEGRRPLIVSSALLALLALFVAASHELVGLLLGGILGVGAGVALLGRDRRGLAWGACAAAAMVGVATVVLAPGNEVRGPTLNPEGPDLGRALQATLLMWVRILDAPVSRGSSMGSYSPLGWIDARLLAATVLFVAAAPVRRLTPEWLRRREALLRRVVPLAWIAAITGTLLAGGWALGRTLPLRAFNALYWVFLLGWFLTAFVYTRPRTGSAEPDPALPLLRTVATVVLALGLLVSTNLKHGVRDLARGSLTGFDRAMKSRYEEAHRVREAGGRELVVSRIDPWPESYFGSDVGDIPPDLQRCVAAYFGLESVRLRTPDAGAEPTLED